MDEYYWIAINLDFLTRYPSGLRPGTFKVLPTPQCYVGFRTREEQTQMYSFLLTATVADRERELPKMFARIHAGEVLYIQPDNPESLTLEMRGMTWVLNTPLLLV